MPASKNLSDSRTNTVNTIMLRTSSKLALGGALSLALALSSSVATAQTIYVDAVDGSNGNSGADWMNAVQTLDYALTQVLPATGVIWVHAHASTPYRLTGSRSSTFNIATESIEIYGGFDGTETSLTQRPNTLFTSTILSGDIGSNSPSTTSDDAFHVVTVSSSITELTFDGFLIEYGNANGTITESRGGGVYFEDGGAFTDVRMKNVTVERCKAEVGGGMYLVGVGNSSATTNLFSRIVVRDCVAALGGATPTGDGGGVYMQRCGPGVAWYNCIFDSNRSAQGGGLFFRNSHEGTGTSCKWQNCLFMDNRAIRGAATGFTDIGLPLQFSHCTYAYNEASIPSGGAGGGSSIYIESSSDLITVGSSIMHENVTKDYSAGGGSLVVYPNNVQFGTGGSASNLDLKYSCVKLDAIPSGGGSFPSWYGTGCIYAHPLFVNGAARNFRLQAGSPALDAADDTFLLADLHDLDDDTNISEKTPLDLGEDPREVDIAGASGGVDAGNLTSGEITDMGAYERQ